MTIFTRRLTHMQIALGICIILPAYLYCLQYPLLMLYKLFVLTTNITTTRLLATSLLNIGIEVITICLSIIVLKEFLKIQIQDLKKHWKHILLMIFVTLFMAYMLEILGSLLSSLFTSQMVSSNQQSLDKLTQSVPLLSLISIIILAPICEELIFRGFIFTSIAHKHKKLAYIISAGLFGILHVLPAIMAGNISEIYLSLPYIFTGLALCFAYDRTNNLFTSIGVHMTINTIASIFMIF